MLFRSEFWWALARSLAFSALVLLIEVPLGIYIAVRLPESGPWATVLMVLLAIPLLPLIAAIIAGLGGRVIGRAASAGPRMPFRTGHEACTVRVLTDGKVSVHSGATSQGQGTETFLAQVVAEVLGVNYADVEVRIGDTDDALWGFGAFSSDRKSTRLNSSH